MKHLFLMLFTLLLGQISSAQSDFVVTFDPDFEEAKNKDLLGVSMTLEAIDLGKYEQLSTGYYLGVESEGGRKICHILSFEGLEKAISMDIYTVHPEFSMKYCKIKKVKNSFDEQAYEVSVSMVMRLTKMSLLLETVDNSAYSEEKTTFTFASETDAQAFVAFMKGE